MAETGDAALAALVATSRDRRAFEQLVRRHEQGVRRVLLHLTLGNETLSDDLAQDTFVKAYTAIGQFRGEASLLTWLLRIAYNTFYDYQRRQAVRPAPGQPAASLSVAAPSAPAGMALDVDHALAQLSESERVCITLQLIEGYAINEISDITGLAPNTVKSHLYRGKQRLTLYLKQNGYG